jgi:hypothetical protein
MYSLGMGIILIYSIMTITVFYKEIMTVIDESKLIAMSLPVLLISVFFIKNVYITIFSSILFLVVMYEAFNDKKPDKSIMYVL